MDKLYPTLKVVVYVAASGAVVALLDWVNALSVADSGVWAVVAVGVTNVILKGARDALRKDR